MADIPFGRNLNEPEDIVTAEYIRAGYQFEHRFSDNWTFRNAFNFTNRRERLENTIVRAVLPTGDLIRNYSLFAFEQDFYELQTNVVGEFSTGSIDHTLLAGVDLYRRDEFTLAGSDFFTNAPLNVFTPIYGQTPRPNFDALPVFFDGDFQLDFLGVYVQDLIAFSDNLKLLAGIRYETFEQERVVAPGPPFLPTGINSTQTGAAFSPRLGVVYHPIEEVSLFASYSRSFGPNPASSASTQFLEPEEGEQFEVGVKAELLGGRLAINLAYFDITLQNVATPDPLDPRFSVVTGEERSQGVELDVAGEILPGWDIVANYAYIDARITESNDANIPVGNRRFNVPEHNFNLWTTYEIQSGSLEGLGFGLGFNVVGDRFGDNANSFVLEDYFLTNAAISYQRDNWRAGLNIRNLFDVDYIEGSRNSRTFSIPPGDGFTLIGSFSIEF